MVLGIVSLLGMRKRIAVKFGIELCAVPRKDYKDIWGPLPCGYCCGKYSDILKLLFFI